MTTKFDKYKLKQFIYLTHEIEGEHVEESLVKDWIDFAFGKVLTPPETRHTGIEGHLQLIDKDELPSTTEGVARMYQMIGAAQGLRGIGQEVWPAFGGAIYSTSDKVLGDLIYWLDQYRGKMGTFNSHRDFELIHPGIDGNGRVGRLILLLGGYSIDNLNRLMSDKGSYLDLLQGL